jgi:hypothetical protein|tara:strand:- start:176 stop:448 length:273 start_codon:yes stop_codon:yes gene_type:complete
MDENGFDTTNVITISVYPSEKGFICSVTEPKYAPLTQEFSVALTIAHGMVKMALEKPDIIFEEGVNALANPQENDNVISLDKIVNKKRLN